MTDSIIKRITASLQTTSSSFEEEAAMVKSGESCSEVRGCLSLLTKKRGESERLTRALHWQYQCSTKHLKPCLVLVLATWLTNPPKPVMEKVVIGPTGCCLPSPSFIFFWKSASRFSRLWSRLKALTHCLSTKQVCVYCLNKYLPPLKQKLKWANSV